MRPATLGTLFGLTAMLLPIAADAAPPRAKITPQQAESAAVKKIPGKAAAAKYEFEDGRWQYAVTVIAKKGGMYEVEVNSTTGLVTDTERTTPAEEAKEAAADKRAAKGHPVPGTAAGKGEAGEKPEPGDKG